MKENVLLEKTFAFAVRAFNVAKYLRDTKQEFIISKQFSCSAISIGANAEEANASQSKREFVSKLPICDKEVQETHYWIRLSEKT